MADISKQVCYLNFKNKGQINPFLTSSGHPLLSVKTYTFDHVLIPSMLKRIKNLKLLLICFKDGVN